MHYNYRADSIIHRDMLMNFSGEWLNEHEKEEYFRNKSQVDEFYHSANVSYTYNSLGYRTKEFTELNEKFFIAMGCSHTEGTGLPEDNIWCNVLSRTMDLDVLNLGAAGQGLQFILYNSYLYIHNNLPRPEFVIIQHPERARKVHAEILEHDNHLNICVRVKDHIDRYTEIEAFENFDISTLFQTSMHTNIVTLLWNSVGVPVYHWTFSTDGEEPLADFDVLEIPRDIDIEHYNYELDFARDLTHHGIKNHSCIANIVHNEIIPYFNNGKLNIPKQWRNRRYCNDDQNEHKIFDILYKILNKENAMSDDNNNNGETHEGSLGTDRNPPSGTEKEEQEAELKRRIEELRKRDPFIYR